MIHLFKQRVLAPLLFRVANFVADHVDEQLRQVPTTELVGRIRAMLGSRPFVLVVKSDSSTDNVMIIDLVSDTARGEATVMLREALGDDDGQAIEDAMEREIASGSPVLS